MFMSAMYPLGPPVATRFLESWASDEAEMQGYWVDW
jgi:hypothetical protein